ncbi:MAG: amino acid permease [Candidatus Eisenbacteria bacterium]|nr:amino acid permease [Candidatus Eisenbacteria bacterium]
MARLERVMGLRDLVLFNIVAIVGLRWVALAAAAGPSALTLWVLALFVFFIPQGMAVARLGSAFPREGGVYVWTREAFGSRHGFIAGWCYWANNVIYYPTLLVAIAGFATFIGGDVTRSLEGNSLYIVAFSLAVLWIALGLNILGLRTGRWVHNLGALSTWIPATLLILFGLVAFWRFGSATAFHLERFLPGLEGRDTISFFAEICFAFAGLELVAVLGDEIRDPRRNLHRGMILAGVVIAAVYLLGTAAILVALPRSEVSIITGVLQAIDAVGSRVGVEGLGSLMALLMVLGGLGGVGAWLGGSARILFVAGLERYLPPALGRVHPRWGSPHVALLVQGFVATAFIILSSLGAGPQEIYHVLVDTTIIVYFIPYVYIFLSLIRLDPALRRRGALPADGSQALVDLPGKAWGSWIFGGLGFAAVALSIVLALVPPAGMERPALHILKVSAGTAFFIVAALVIYERGRRRMRRRPPGS